MNNDESIPQQLRQSTFNKYISLSSPKYKPSAIINQLTSFSINQQNIFQQIQKYIKMLEDMIYSLEDKVDQLGSMVQNVGLKEMKTIHNLKIKQNQFIINQLREKIRKLQRNQQNIEIENRHLKKQLDGTKKQRQKQTNQSRILKQKQKVLQKQLKQKNLYISQLKQSPQKVSKVQTIIKQQEYKILQSKLTQLQQQFEQKLSSTQQQLQQKSKRIKQLEQLIQKQSQQTDKIIQRQSQQTDKIILRQSQQTYKKSIVRGSYDVVVYQLETKLAQQTKMYLQLETDYNKLLNTSNQLQIQLHQQIYQLKAHYNDEKKARKKDKKHITDILLTLARQLTKRSYVSSIDINTNNQIQTIVQEIKRNVSKQHQKQQTQINQLKKQQCQYKQKIIQLQTQLKRVKNKQVSYTEQIQALHKKLSQRQKQKRMLQRRQSSSNKSSKGPQLNTSFGSHNKSQTTSIYQDKFKQIIQSLRLQVHLKQQKINQLELLQSIDFQKSKQKILLLEGEMADLRNQFKRSQRQHKQCKQTIESQQKDIQTRKQQKVNIHQKYQKDKQQIKLYYQQKITTYEEKISKLKQVNTLLQTKCQQRIMKYNKLKSKLQKLQMYYSQTQKRKDIQIQEMIKKNQQIKMELKIQKDKQTLSIIDTNHSEETPYNKDLVEQIQMERDRILLQYQTKKKDNSKLKQIVQKFEIQCKKLTSKILILQTQKQKALKQVRSSKQQLQSFNKQLHSSQVTTQQLKLQLDKVKLQLQQIKKQNLQKSKQQYVHLKKQLQTQLSTRKSLQHELKQQKQRLKQQKQQFNDKCKELQKIKEKDKLIQGLQKNLTNQKHINDKLRDKAATHINQINYIKAQCDKKLKDTQRKLAQAIVKQQNLVNIINYKNQNTQNGSIRTSMLIEQELNHQHIDELKHQYIEELNHERIEEEPNCQNIQQNKTHEEAQQNSLQKGTKCQTSQMQTNTQRHTLIIQHIKLVNIQAFARHKGLLSICHIGNIIIPSKKPIVESKQVNTQAYQKQMIACKSSRSSLKADMYILGDELLGSYHQSSIDINEQRKDTLQRSRFDPNAQKNQVQVNLFSNLQINHDIDDNFQICQEGEELNIGQTALNLQIKDIFNKLRDELEKVFNGEQISLSMIKLLPPRMQDDYNQFISYIREKIQQIKSQNQLSFIMAQTGESPQQQQLDAQLQGFIQKKVSQDIYSYKKLLQQKQALLTSLMNQRTMQQNTINQMAQQREELEQEGQNRFMNQCNIYKKEIKQLKNKYDLVEMNFMSLKNVFRNVMEIYLQKDDNTDDLTDNLEMYAKIARLSENQKNRLNHYATKYTQIKLLQSR